MKLSKWHKKYRMVKASDGDYVAQSRKWYQFRWYDVAGTSGKTPHTCQKRVECVTLRETYKPVVVEVEL